MSAVDCHEDLKITRESFSFNLSGALAVFPADRIPSGISDV